MIAETKPENCEKIWKKFLRKHWKMLIIFVIEAILAFIGVILVYLWFVVDAQATGMVPETLGLWSMGHFVTFLLNLIAREVLFIGVPVIIAAALTYFIWWKKLPSEERKEYRDRHLFGKRSHKTDGGEGISFLVSIVFCIKVYLDGNWDVPFATWKFDYLVYSCLWAFIWVLIIFGIPIAIGGIWWLHREMKKEP
jgi:hypothetical protein